MSSSTCDAFWRNSKISGFLVGADKMDTRRTRGANSVQAEVESLFQAALDQAFPALGEAPLVTPTKPKDAKYGDYQCNNAMKLFNSLRGKVVCSK